MKTKKLLLLFCFSFLIIGFQNNIVAQAIKIDDHEEWREGIVEDFKPMIEFIAADEIKNKEMMTFILFSSVSVISILSKKSG